MQASPKLKNKYYDYSVCKGSGCQLSERKTKCFMCNKKMCKNCGVNNICKNCIAYVLEKQTFIPMVYIKPDSIKATVSKEIRK